MILILILGLYDPSFYEAISYFITDSTNNKCRTYIKCIVLLTLVSYIDSGTSTGFTKNYQWKDGNQQKEAIRNHVVFKSL